MTKTLAKFKASGIIALSAIMSMLISAGNVLAQVDGTGGTGTGTATSTTGGTGAGGAAGGLTGTGTATATPGVPVTGAGGDSIYTLFLLGLSLLVIVAGISYFYLRREDTSR